MWNAARRYLRAPTFPDDEDKTRAAELLHSILLAILIVTILYTLFARVDVVSQLLEIVVPLALLQVGLLIMVRRGRVAFASTGLVVGLWLILFYASYINGGVNAPAFSGFIVVVLVAAFLLGARWGIFTAGFSVAAGFMFIFIEQRGALPIPAGQSLFTVLLAQITYFVVVAVILALATRSIERAFARARTELQQRVETEKQLQQAQARYRDMVERVPAVIYSAEPGSGGNWLYVSPRIESLTGYSADEWIADRNIWHERMHPEDHDEVMMGEAHTLAEGKKFEAEYRFYRRDGRLIWLRDESLPAEDDSVTGRRLVKGLLLDITDRKLAELERERLITELESKNVELAAVNDVSQLLVAESDLSELIDTVGEKIRHLFDIPVVYIALYETASNLLHFNYYFDHGQHQPPSTWEYRPGMISHAMQSRRPILINSDWVHAAAEFGTWYEEDQPARASLTVPLLVGDSAIGVISLQDMVRENVFDDGDVRLLTTIASNVAVAIENSRLQTALRAELAERKQLIEQLGAKNAELERFTYTISHDLKSPVITMRGFLGYIEQDAASGNMERVKEDIRRISDATDKMRLLLDELLELSRIGRVVEDPKLISFDELVREAIELVHGRILARHIHVDVQSELPAVYGDYRRLLEVLQNLLDNSAKYMGDQESPHIQIGQRGEDDGKPVFFVEDNGIGIASEYHQKIFGLFDKLDGDSEGTGIGLALVKRIIEIHGGRIWVESALGSGAAFYFTLPGEP